MAAATVTFFGTVTLWGTGAGGAAYAASLELVSTDGADSAVAAAGAATGGPAMVTVSPATRTLKGRSDVDGGALLMPGVKWAFIVTREELLRALSLSQQHWMASTDQPCDMYMVAKKKRSHGVGGWWCGRVGVREREKLKITFSHAKHTAPWWRRTDPTRP